jgi:hypothetical protein
LIAAACSHCEDYHSACSQRNDCTLLEACVASQTRGTVHAADCLE